jgi:hypothetical protein
MNRALVNFPAGPYFDGEHLGRWQLRTLDAWLADNGVREQIPASSKVIIKGNHVHVETFAGLRRGRPKAALTLWPKHPHWDWEPRTRRRAYRIRRPLGPWLAARDADA